MMKKRVGRILLALGCLVLVASLSACGGGDSQLLGLSGEKAQDQAGTEQDYAALSDFSGARFGALNGAVADQLVQSVIPDAEDFSYYNSVPDLVSALKAGRVDAGVLDQPVAQLAVAKNEGIRIFQEPVVPDAYGYAFRKGSELVNQFNLVIEKFYTDGTLDALNEKWMGADDSRKVVPEQTWPGTNGTLRYYHGYTHEPMAYLSSSGDPLGLEIELALLIAKELDLKLEMTSCEFGALITSLESGKADMVSGSMSITEERLKKVDFTNTHCQAALVLIVADRQGTAGQTSFWDRVANSFNSTFVVESRWKLVAEGLGVTVLISVLSGIFGLILGFGLCMLRRMQNKPAQWSAAVFVRLIQGMPVVVFLMILYYVIFGSMDISAILVSVIGFSINFAAYTSEMMRAGIETVDKGQSEAALAMGYSKSQTFWKVVFPQAAKNFLPVMKGEFISMVKMTSIVGYIAVQDLTKVSDIIRSRTMEAFFPLLATAVIYFIIANLLTEVLSMIESRVQPKRKKRAVKGVGME